MLSRADFPLPASLVAELRGLCPTVREHVPLSAISRWRVGGEADLLLNPSHVDEVVALRRFFARHGIPHVVIGLTSNLLFSDSGLRVPCIQIGTALGGVQIEQGNVVAEGGVWVPGFARRLQRAGLSGAEHICGIPGTLGGLVCMNGGSQRKAIGDSVISVTSVDGAGELITRSAAQCNFAYRQSVFQGSGEIVVQARFTFSQDVSSASIRRTMLEILASRRTKFPQKLPNCGSVFKSNPRMYEDVGPPGAVIESLGFKGMAVGGALVSPQHANFIVNTGNASARDVLALVGRIQRTVREKTGHTMHAEAYYVSEHGAFLPADQAAAKMDVPAS